MSARRSLLLVLAIARARWPAVVGAAYGARDGLLTVAAAARARRRRRSALAHALARPARAARVAAPPVRASASAIAVGQLVVLAAVAAQLMFVSAHDALLV